MSASPVIDTLRRAWPDAVLEEVASADMPTVYADREHLLGLLKTLRDDASLQFSLLVDVTAADYLPAEPRFEVVYHLACLGESYSTAGAPAAPLRRLRLKVRLSGGDARIPSIVSLYPGAGWPEREVFDLFGIAFEGHPDLRRILTPDGWEGYPLRKDYPVQVRKDTPAWSPVQLSPEEFAENVRAERESATRTARSKT
jgi:NADH-quinone oxidoreductase subunit C